MASKPTGRKRGRPSRSGRKAERPPWRVSPDVIQRVRSTAAREGIDAGIVFEQKLRSAFGMPLLILGSEDSGPVDDRWCPDAED